MGPAYGARMTPGSGRVATASQDLTDVLSRLARARSYGTERLATGRSLRRERPPAGHGDDVAWTTDVAAVGLAPFSEGFRSSFTGFYHGVLLADGYPGRLLPDGSVVAHPIYGTYVLADYLQQAVATGDRRYLDSATTVARAAVDRMETLRDALVFPYEPCWRLSSLIYDRHYSALTQGYYAVLLRRIGAMSGEVSLERAAARTFASLLVPASAGGVMEEGEHGLAFAEVPTRPMSLVLNGWQSTLHSMGLYADLADDPDLRDLVRRSACTMLDLLPTFDVPEVANSRYSLSGHLHVRVLFQHPGTGVRSLHVEIPRCGRYKVRTDAEEPTPWRMYVRSGDLVHGRAVGRGLRANVVLSRVSWPVPNTLELEIDSARAQSVRVQVLGTRYEPCASTPGKRWWRTVARADVTGGTRSLSVPIPWDAVPWVGYPTQFNKVIDGRRTNVYHGLHVRRLRALGRSTGVSELGEWADRWAAYADGWTTMRRYRGLHGQR